MSENPMQKLSVLRFLFLMLEKRIETDGAPIEGETRVVLFHEDGTVSLFEENDGVFLGITKIGETYKLDLLTQPRNEGYSCLLNQENLPVWASASQPTIDDWEKITSWVREGTLIKAEN